MPLFENQCVGPKPHRFEWFASNRNLSDPPCRECGEPTRRLISRFAAIWTKNISEYGDKTKETYAQDIKNGGHVVYRKRSRGGTLDKPIKDRVRTIQEQKTYCREEGLLNPSDVGNVSVDSTGTKCSTESGQWV